MTEEQARAFFLLAGFSVKKVMKLANEYWPDNPHYDEVRRNSPWWLMMTEHGPIRIGWRKRVISIDWSNTEICSVVTEDNVTKDDSLVHAYTHAKVVEYLTALKRAAVSTATKEQTP